MPKNLTHINEKGVTHMVDVSAKKITHRQAIAEGCVVMHPETLIAIEDNQVAKGDVLACARIAGIMAAKNTAQLIPLCHPLALTKITLDIEMDKTLPGVRVRAMVTVDGKTGVEMEALSGVCLACLTVYDMVKAIDKDMRITDIHVVEKIGGKSRYWKK